MWWLFSCAGPTTAPDPDPAALPCTAVEALTAPQPAGCGAEPAARCGGDPSGTWVATSRCDADETAQVTTPAVETVSGYACPEDTFVTESAFDETIDVKADGTFTWTTVTSASETWTVPSSCLADLGSEDCASLSAAYGFPCAEATEACVCTVTARDTRVFFGGRWEVCDASLVFVSLDGTATSTASGEATTKPIGENQSQVWDFCADGDTLRLFSWQGTLVSAYARAE